MLKLVSKPEYEEQTAAGRDRRMAWWREEKYGKRAICASVIRYRRAFPPCLTSGILSPAFRKLPSSRFMIPSPIPPVYHSFQNENCCPGCLS
jgi:hypothetical protein